MGLPNERKKNYSQLLTWLGATFYSTVSSLETWVKVSYNTWNTWNTLNMFIQTYFAHAIMQNPCFIVRTCVCVHKRTCVSCGMEVQVNKCDVIFPSVPQHFALSCVSSAVVTELTSPISPTQRDPLRQIRSQSEQQISWKCGTPGKWALRAPAPREGSGSEHIHTNKPCTMHAPKKH